MSKALLEPGTVLTHDLVVSIVHYNTPALLERCLEALAAEGSDLRVRVVVVDNASLDAPGEDLARRFPEVTFLRNESNVGFGGGNNRALRSVKAEAYLVTNPDVIVAPGSLRLLLERLLARPRLGVVGPRLRYADGRVQSSCRRYPTLLTVLVRGLLPERLASSFGFMRRYLMTDDMLDRPTRVDWMLGSCLLIKRDALLQAGGFDERFFMYYEDIDLCYRIAHAGWDIEHHPDVEWTHDYRRQSARVGQWRLRAVHFVSAMKFLLKHLPRRGLLASLGISK
ncbi:MAG: glycosyltransferase family 2 protein [Elusimicrobia bacterium]|nr:glycosyltransferase family 2 protein [Elusimicrobiota bacterium]